jgi:hypothetical protein
MNSKSLLVGLTLAVGTFSGVAPSNAASQKPYRVAETQTELYIRVQKEMADQASADTDRVNAEKTPAQMDVDTYRRAQDATGTVGLAHTPKVDPSANPDTPQGAPSR